MNLTIKPIAVFDHANAVRPEFIRLPKPGTCDPWTSLSRSTLNLLVLPCRENDYRPPVRSCTLRRKGTTKGVRLIDLQSLLDYINAHVEPGCVADKPQESNAPEGPENAFVQKLRLTEPFRIIISMRVEKESDPTPEGGNVSPLCVHGAAR
jgi:hypothetical protein